MPVALTNCRYCGYTEKQLYFSQMELEDMKCGLCKDENLTISLNPTRDVYGYDYKKEDKLNEQRKTKLFK